MGVDAVSWLWVLGVGMGVGGTLTGTLSKIYMKKAHDVDDDSDAEAFAGPAAKKSKAPAVTEAHVEASS